MENETFLLEELADPTTDSGSSVLTPEEEIVRGFRLSPPGSPVQLKSADWKPTMLTITPKAAEKFVSDDGTSGDSQDPGEQQLSPMVTSPEKVPIITQKIATMTLESPPKPNPLKDRIIPTPNTKRRVSFSPNPIVHIISSIEPMDLDQHDLDNIPKEYTTPNPIDTPEPDPMIPDFETLIPETNPIFPDLETLIPAIFYEICSEPETPTVENPPTVETPIPDIPLTLEPLIPETTPVVETPVLETFPMAETPTLENFPTVETPIPEISLILETPIPEILSILKPQIPETTHVLETPVPAPFPIVVTPTPEFFVTVEDATPILSPATDTQILPTVAILIPENPVVTALQDNPMIEVPPANQTYTPFDPFTSPPVVPLMSIVFDRPPTPPFCPRPIEHLLYTPLYCTNYYYSNLDKEY
ncbi:unnamed protein product [Allacma fusca]|uniref:Uncharacterized protein n=1 Tax=Allacma fusca TaxID=39272 RepID=A0A8J2LHZ1_9HEXA|nr:unnamed protein product [Allacma fusca]